MLSKTHFTYYFILMFLCACGNKKDNKTSGGDKSRAPVAIDVSIARFQEFNDAIEASGTVLAGEYVELKPEISGRIVALNIQEGRQVSEGTLLVKLFDDDLQAQLRKNQAQLGIAVATEKRLKALLDVNGLNRAEYDQALTQVNNIQADIDYTKAQIRRTEIRAPFNGTVGLRTVSKGAYVGPQDILATMQQTGTLKIDFVLPESYSTQVKIGSVVEIRNDRQQELQATVIALEPQVNVDTRNIKVRAILRGQASGLNPGAFVKVVLDNGKGKKAILVPSNVIIPETRNKKIVLIKGGKARFTTVVTGYRGEDKVEIVSGMEQGDTFAINGILFLKPDADVKIKQVK